MSGADICETHTIVRIPSILLAGVARNCIDFVFCAIILRKSALRILLLINDDNEND